MILDISKPKVLIRKRRDGSGWGYVVVIPPKPGRVGMYQFATWQEAMSFATSLYAR